MKKLIVHRHYFYPNFADNYLVPIDGVSDSYRKEASVSYRWCYCPLGKEHETMTKNLELEYRYGDHNKPPFTEDELNNIDN